LYHPSLFIFFFFFTPTATTEIYTLSLHDALPIYRGRCRPLALGGLLQVLARGGPGEAGIDQRGKADRAGQPGERRLLGVQVADRSEEHTSELQSRGHLVCRLLLEKKKKEIHADNV